MPKERWPEIEIAEKFTPEGEEMWQKLKGELLKDIFN
jgi:hypothetical protein